jgi:HEPN domain-containing protein
VTAEVSHDLRRLFREAETRADPVSQRIVENIDEWLRKELKMAIEEQLYLENPVVDIQMFTSKHMEK